ncbi:MAG: flagellar protein FlgN [Nitrospirota bacterium]
MTHLYDELIGVLEKEFALCTSLVELLQREKEVIVKLDPGALEQLLTEKEVLTTSIRACDEARERILDTLQLKNKTLSEVAASAGELYRDRLADLSTKFTSIIESITELNAFNSKLIEKSLHYIKTSYRFLNTFDVDVRQKVSLEA